MEGGIGERISFALDGRAVPSERCLPKLFTELRAFWKVSDAEAFGAWRDPSMLDVSKT